MSDDLIDRIYECSFVPELWPEVLDELALLSDAEGGLLFSARKVLNWTSSRSIGHVFQAYVDDGWFEKCSRRVCLMSQTQPTFLVEHDFWTDDQLNNNPIYRDFFRPRGLGWSAGTGLRMPTGDNIVFSIERAHSRGPLGRTHVERLNELRPHLARSAFVTARLGLERAKGGSDMLAAMRLPAVLLAEDGTVVEANAMIEELDLVEWRARGRIALSDARASAQLAVALASLETVTDASSRSFPLRDADNQVVMVAHVVPIARSAHDIFARSYALLVLTPVVAQRGPPLDLLRSLFDLTVVEARIARGIAGGSTLEHIATDGGVAVGTVRKQLQTVFQKTGCSRQAELAALLAGVTLERSGS